MMTLDEAIKRCVENSDDRDYAEEFKMLYKYLKELRALRQFFKEVSDDVCRADAEIHAIREE